MVFKMLILLGFFTVQEGFIIHSDIHRSIVDRADYEPQKTVADFRAQNALKCACAIRVLWPIKMGAVLLFSFGCSDF
jgi:hypothetical protein